MFIGRHPCFFPGTPVDRRHRQALLPPEVRQTVEIGVRGGVGRLARGTDEGSHRRKKDEQVQFPVPGYFVKIPGAGRLGFEHPAEPIGGLGEQNAVVQDAGRVENAPDRLILPGQVRKETFHCLAVGHIGLDILHFPVGTGVQRRFLPAPATRNDYQAGFSIDQPPRQEATDPSRAPRYEIGSSRTYDRIVLSQVHWNGRSVVHEDQFSHVARLCHVPESLLRMSHR